MTRDADRLRPGDRVALSDGTVVTIDELPWLSGNALLRARVRFADGRTGLATWGPRFTVPIAVDRPDPRDRLGRDGWPVELDTPPAPARIDPDGRSES